MAIYSVVSRGLASRRCFFAVNDKLKSNNTRATCDGIRTKTFCMTKISDTLRHSKGLDSVQDVIIVGAGIAGLRCAELLSGAGLDVMVLEKNQTVGGNFGEDMEGFPAYQYSELDLRVPSSPVRRISLWAGTTTRAIFEFDEPVLSIVKRGSAEDSIDSYLLRRALKAGAKVTFAEEVTKISGTDETSEVATSRTNTFRSKVVVAADGVFSSVRNFLGLEHLGTHGVGYIAKMEGTNVPPSEIVGVFSYRVAPMAYGYVIGYPDGRHATVGVTLRPDYVNRPIKEYFNALNNYVSDLTSGARIVEEFRGFVTAGKGDQTVVKGNTVFIGEAGGFQDPVMGFGMAPALRSASLGAQTVRSAIESHDMRILRQFQAKARETLIRGEAARNWGFRDFLLESLTEADMEFLVRLMGDRPITLERILRTGRYKRAVLPLGFEALTRRPQLLLTPFRFTQRKLFGERKVSPSVETYENVGRTAPAIVPLCSTGLSDS